MNTTQSLRNGAALGLLLSALSWGMFYPLPALAQQPAASGTSAADQAWAETEAALEPVPPPAEWQERRPTREEVNAFREQQGKRAVVAADRARSFHETYPDHAKAGEAREKEFEMIQIAVQLGNTNAITRLETLEEAKLEDPSLSEDERFELRSSAVQRAAMRRAGKDREALMTAYEEAARELIQEFPDRDEPYQILLSLARSAEADQARAIAEDIIDSSASEALKESAQGLLARFDALGKPLDIKFTAIDGREVDLGDMKGKVVLLDFWATWCGPCIAELPKVKAAYESLHPEGFEIVGISFDDDREKLENLVEKEEMPWPQYFDGNGWKNELGQRFGINSIPTMWLVDKEGNLVDMNARNNLEDKVKRLLDQ